jgi:hypothetical protein
MDNPELTQQQQALLEQYVRANAAWLMAVNHEDDACLVALLAASDACLAAGIDPAHYLAPQ